jgi:hypothetical protein
MPGRVHSLSPSVPADPHSCIASQAGPFDAWLPSSSVMVAVAAAAAVAVGTGRLFRNAAAEDFYIAAALHLTTGVVGMAVCVPVPTGSHSLCCRARSTTSHRAGGGAVCLAEYQLNTRCNPTSHSHRIAMLSDWHATERLEAYGRHAGGGHLRRGRRRVAVQAVAAAVWKLDRPFCAQLAALRRGTLAREIEAKAR